MKVKNLAWVDPMTEMAQKFDYKMKHLLPGSGSIFMRSVIQALEELFSNNVPSGANKGKKGAKKTKTATRPVVDLEHETDMDDDDDEEVEELSQSLDDTALNFDWAKQISSRNINKGSSIAKGDHARGQTQVQAQSLALSTDDMAGLSRKINFDKKRFL